MIDMSFVTSKYVSSMFILLLWIVSQNYRICDIYIRIYIYIYNHGAGRLLRACDHYERGSGLMDVIEAEDMGMPGEIPEISGTQQLEQVQH